jgi:hypothetical protein
LPVGPVDYVKDLVQMALVNGKNITVGVNAYIKAT